MQRTPVYDQRMQNTSAYKLYARPGAGSAAVEALLAILGVAHDVVDVPKEADGTAPDWYRAINPRTEVPALQLPDGSIMTESAAMMIHLADCHPEAGLAPRPGTAERAQYLRWLSYLSATVYSTDLRLYYPERYSTDPAHADAVKARASSDLARDYAIFDQEMGKGPFITGKTMTAADIYAAMLLSWSDDFPGLMKAKPKLKALYDAIAAHPKIAPVWRRNGMP
ncbi:MAG: glutathione S-transferase family protein [Rhizobiales bacterium]|nr:glutathione S-transferase family protein [Hyphomicrobiales bacterium]